MTATLEPVVVRLDRTASVPARRSASRSTTRPSGAGGLLLASLVIVWVPAVLLGGAVQLTVALGLGALLAVGFLLTCRHQRTRARRIAATRTRGALADAADAGSVHGWIEGLTLPQGTVGHLVLNPAGAFVVSSVWHGVGLSDATLERDAALVRAAATHTRALLGARSVETIVRPVVAVWGAAGADLPGRGVESDDVLVVRGTDLGDLLAWTSAHGGSWSHAQAADLMLDLTDVPVVGSTLVLSTPVVTAA